MDELTRIKDRATIIEEAISSIADHCKDGEQNAVTTMALLTVAARIIVRQNKLMGDNTVYLALGASKLVSFFLHTLALEDKR